MEILGIIFFWFMLLLAFWVLIFALAFAVPYMAIGLILENFFPSLAEKIYGDKEEE